MKRFIICFILVPVFAFTFVKCGTEKETDYDVVIIGAGGGGMSAAARLSLDGKKTLVIEKNDKVGGYMTNFKKGDYIFEVSMHSIDGFNEGWFNRKMFKKLGILDKMKPVKMDPMYRALYPDMTVEIPADIDAYMALLKKMFPHEVEGIDDLFDTLDDIMTAQNCGMHFTTGEYVTGIFKSLINIPSFITFYKYLDSTLTEFLDEYVKDEKLISMITQLTGLLSDAPEKISGIVFAAALNQYHKGGYYYFEGDGDGGGSHAVISALESIIKENGGDILLNTMATKIIIKDGLAKAVQTGDGKKYTCKYVISNSNALDTVNKLIGRERFSDEYLEKLDKMAPGLTCFVVYLGVNKDYRKNFPKGSHVILQNVSYNAVRSYKYIREGNVDKMPFALLNFSCIDKVAPEGKNALNITTVMPYEWNNGWHYDNKTKYEALKKETAMRLVKRVEKILPGVSRHIEVMEVFTPKTLESYSMNTKGAILGWDNTVDQVMLNRLPQETAVDNVLLAGAWTFPSGGQSTVLMSGLLAAEKILDDM